MYTFPRPEKFPEPKLKVSLSSLHLIKDFRYRLHGLLVFSYWFLVLKVLYYEIVFSMTVAIPCQFLFLSLIVRPVLVFVYSLWKKSILLFCFVRPINIFTISCRWYIQNWLRNDVITSSFMFLTSLKDIWFSCKQPITSCIYIVKSIY